MIGRIVGSNYRIVEKIGEGGMGAVYRAVDQMLERDVALKAIRPELSREPEIIERFRAEARTLARITHPAIATIYSFFYESEELFLAMEFVRGRPLSRVLAHDGPIAWDRAVALLATAMDGIQVAHDAGIVHRDLKPENLMVTEAGTLKVMDFGIARVMGSGHLTRTGLLVGTLRYMSPEQIRGEEVDGRTDVYALGAVLFEMLTGRPPFEGSSDWAILRAQIEDTPRPPSDQIPRLPWWIDRAVLKALAKEPAERFQTVEEMRRTLIRQGETMPGRPAPVAVESIEELPTVVTPPSGQRTPTPPPLPPPSSATAPLSVPPLLPAAALPGPPPSSYRPIEISRQGTSAGKLIAAAALIVALLGAGGLLLWISRDGTPEVAQTDVPEQTAPAETADDSNGTEMPAAIPAPETGTPASATFSAPVPPPSRQTAPPPPEPQEPEPLPRNEPEVSAIPAYVPPVEEPTVSEKIEKTEAQAPLEEMRRLAGDLQTRSPQLLETFQTWLETKDEAGQEITDDDEQLEEDIEELADMAEGFHNFLEGGGLIARVRKRRAGEDVVKVQQRARELARRGQRVDDLMSKTQPGPEVRQAWQEVRRKWKRVAEIAGGLR
ncbi:MAG TPA: serine/threonine-protein kinase [Thermoanaerobaculia bacterium]|nr:serine/threonine-protein kinase [Thermoanaerobaculia bacterium]